MESQSGRNGEVNRSVQLVSGVTATKTTIDGRKGTFGAVSGESLHPIVTEHYYLEDPNHRVMISAVLGGDAHYSVEGDILDRTSSLVAIHPDKPIQTRWTRGHEVYISFRSALKHAEPLTITQNRVAIHPLSPFLRSQLVLIEKSARKLSKRELSILVDGAHDLGSVILEGALPDTDFPDLILANGLLAAARRHMALNYHRPLLHADVIAREFSCSRATLYRAFSLANSSVIEELKDIRLLRAQRILMQPAPVLIAIVARQCGFLDASTFSRLFRKKFNLSPGEFVASHAEKRG